MSVLFSLALFLPRGMPLSSLVQLSPRHSQGPIVVAAHNCHLDDVLAQVPPARHSNLVLVQNGRLDGLKGASGISPQKSSPTPLFPPPRSPLRAAWHSDLVLVQNGMLDGWLAAHGLSHAVMRLLLYMAASAAQENKSEGGAPGEGASEGGAPGEGASGRGERVMHVSCRSQQHESEEEAQGVVCEPPAQSRLPECFTSSPRYPHGVRITDGGGRSVATGR
ncbi:unnamed protein product [Closterium sp. Naga37s-1]|nr:unnamed protein product [Closterium sp. Naga37s-1]